MHASMDRNMSRYWISNGAYIFSLAEYTSIEQWAYLCFCCTWICRLLLIIPPHLFALLFVLWFPFLFLRSFTMSDNNEKPKTYILSDVNYEQWFLQWVSSIGKLKSAKEWMFTGKRPSFVPDPFVIPQWRDAEKTVPLLHEAEEKSDERIKALVGQQIHFIDKRFHLYGNARAVPELMDANTQTLVSANMRGTLTP